jgi:hypothetical protein
MKIKRAVEALAFHHWTDVESLRDYQYQPSRYKAIFTIADSYMTATTTQAPCPRFARETGGTWEKVATEFAWSIWRFIK